MNYVILGGTKPTGFCRSSSGEQAILTMRGWDQNKRSIRPWPRVAATYQRDIMCSLTSWASRPGTTSSDVPKRRDENYTRSRYASRFARVLNTDGKRR
jgi:hypothetical protein